MSVGQKIAVRLLDLADHCKHVVFTHQQVLDVVDFDLLSCVATEQHDIAVAQLAFRTRAVIKQTTAAYGNDRAPSGLLASRIRKNNSACGCLFTLDSLNDDSLAHGLKTYFGLFFGGGCHRWSTSLCEREFVGLSFL